MAAGGRLLVLSPLTAVPTASGKVIITEKFISGLSTMARSWGGPSTAVLEPSSQPTDNLDNIEIDPAELPFELKVMRYDTSDLEREISASDIVLSFACHRQNGVAALCRRVAVPCVYTTEYALRTRWQIIRAERRNPLRRARGYLWEWNQERRQRRAIRQADGVQCNGTPTHEAYRTINPSSLLFFDSRIESAMLPDADQIEARAKRLLQGGPLQLIFFGRLIKMKGADHLPRVAEALVRVGVNFEMYICGGGVLEPFLAAEIQRRELQARVRLAGTLDFNKELVPFLKDQGDLFVCCHRQGDPSCSYVEALACGLPIVGYANEALAGMLTVAKVGWSVPIDRPEALAEVILELDRNRTRIAAAAARAVEFAKRHTHEETTARRVDHLRSLALRSRK